MGVELNNGQIFVCDDLEHWWYHGTRQIRQIEGKAGTGKAQPVDTLIPTPDGDRYLGDLKVGDYVFNRFGKKVKILGVYDQGLKEAFRVTFEDGRSTICCDEHLWTYYDLNDMLVTKSLREIIEYISERAIEIPVNTSLTGLTYDRVKIRTIEDLGYETEMRCIYVDDPEHLYLTNDYIVTHNTTLIRYFIDRIGLSYDEVLFVAYMGKAVNQLNKNGLVAKTIHSACYDCVKVPLTDENGNIVRKKNNEPKMKIDFVLKEKIPNNPKLIVIDEGFMVPEDQARDLISFNIPIIVLGDSNQLPPVFGKPYFFRERDLILTEIMRQKEGDPIVYLANKLLSHERLKDGIYGNSAVMPKKNITDFQLKSSDVILTCTNKVRDYVNNIFREDLLNIGDLSFPHYGEKIICRKNNWNKKIKLSGSELYLTNGLAGYVDYVDPESYNRKSITIDFRPEFAKKVFRNMKLNIPYINEPIGNHNTINFDTDVNDFEYAYAISTWLAQGSEYGNVLFMDEGNFFGNEDDYFRLLYTAVTRASNSIIYAH